MIGPYLPGRMLQKLVKESDEQMKRSDAWAKMYAMNAMIGIVDVVENHREVIEAAGAEKKAHDERVCRWITMLHPRTRRRYEKEAQETARQLAALKKKA